MNRRLMLALCLLLPGCGNDDSSDSLTSATTIAATTFSTLTFTSTVSGAPVAGANIVVAGTAYTSGADGTINLSTPAASGATLDATAAGYLSRVTVVGSDPAITLWEIPSGADAAFVRQLAYNREGTAESLWRPVSPTVSLQLVGELASDPVARAAHIQAAAITTAMTGARVNVALGSGLAGGVIVTALLNPSVPGAATTYVSQSGGAVQSARVEYRSVAAARSAPVIAHELGHVLGFGHAPTGLMCPDLCGVDSFSPTDQAVFVSMWQRRPGTAPLDNDRALGALSEGAVAVFNCGIR